jgi:hypothetical protein
MTNPGDTITAPNSREPLDWARKALEVPEGLDPRAHVLRCLAEQEFVLYGFQREAADVIWGRYEKRLGNGESAFEAARTQKVGEAIDQFAAEFFSLPADIRRQRWSDLKQSRGLSPPQRLRLDHLQRGLVVVPAFNEGTFGLSRLGEFAAVICELFVLAPPARAQRRAAFLKRAERDRRQWAEAAAKLRHADASVANLLPEFVGEVATLDLTRIPSPSRRRQRRAAAEKYSEPAESGGRGWVWGIIAVSVLTTIVRLASDSGNERQPPSNHQLNPSFKLPSSISSDELRRGMDVFDINQLSKNRKAQRERLKKLMAEAGLDDEAQRRMEKQIDELDRRELDLRIQRNRLVAKQRSLKGSESPDDFGELVMVEIQLEAVKTRQKLLDLERKELLKRLDSDDQLRRKAEEATRILFGKPPKPQRRETGDP